MGRPSEGGPEDRDEEPRMYAEKRQHAIARLVHELGRLSVTESSASEQREEIVAAGPRLVEA